LPVPLSAVLAVDCVAATVAATAVSPFVAIIDQSVISSAAGAQSLSVALKSGLTDLLFTPSKFARNPAFVLMCMVYSGTYAAANTADSVGKHLQKKDSTPTVIAAAIARGLPKFISSSSANMVLSMYKDVYIARMYSTGPPAQLSMAAFSMFMGRDIITMASSFTLPGPAAEELHRRTSLSPSQCGLIAQLSLPVLFQTITCPLHLLGLSFMMNPSSSFSDRMLFLQEKVIGSTAIRMLRIFPAFGVGGVTNTELRKKGNAIIEQYYLK